MTCIIWPGEKNTKGYGRKWINCRKYLAHRLAYCTHYDLDIGDIDRKVVRHTCDNPPCVNPYHLVLGTQADNLADMRAKGRDDKSGLINGCKKGKD